MTQGVHYSVLLKESVDALVVSPDGNYVDGTFGRGGHSREILQRLSSKGSVMAFDKDPQAVAMGRQLEGEDGRFKMIHGSFVELEKYREAEPRLNGVLLDLGVSSPQLDDAARGFSFLHDGPLDMRMNNQSGESAAQWLAKASEEEIAAVLKTYGEERFARRMARAIVEARIREPISRTAQLAQIVSAANPKWEKGKHPATRAFQAIRIYINGELEELQKMLALSLDLLAPGGRMVVISFHSLEDRIVKRFFKAQAKGKTFPRNVPVTEDMLGKTLKLIGKAVRAGEKELAENLRSRSAIMRVAERI